MSWVGMTISLLPVTMLARLALPILAKCQKNYHVAKRMNWFVLATVAKTLTHVANGSRLIYFIYTCSLHESVTIHVYYDSYHLGYLDGYYRILNQTENYVLFGVLSKFNTVDPRLLQAYFMAQETL